MSIALFLVLGLLSLCPMIVTLDGAVLSSLVPLLISTGLIVAALKLQESEVQHLGAVLSRSIVVIAALPAGLMIVQMLPLQFLANPVWTSVSAGFPHGIAGCISVDIGATATALSRYLSVAGAAVLSAAVATDRSRAEAVLAGVLASCVVISLASLYHDLVSPRFHVNRGEALDCACVGVTLAAACGIFVFERYERRRYKPNQNQKKFLFWGLICLTAFVTCAGAVAVTRSGPLTFAAAAGFLTFGANVVIRRFNLGRFGAAAIGITAVIIGATLVKIMATDSDPRFAFAQKAEAAVEITKRILADAPLFGDGAGTFAALARLYRSSGDGLNDIGAVTAAAQFSIEMGRAPLWIAVMTASFAFYVLLRGAAQRGRDSSYAAGAGACIVTLIILAFVNTGLAGQGVNVLSALVFGLGLAQSKSRVLGKAARNHATIQLIAELNSRPVDGIRLRNLEGKVRGNALRKTRAEPVRRIYGGCCSRSSTWGHDAVIHAQATSRDGRCKCFGCPAQMTKPSRSVVNRRVLWRDEFPRRQ